MKYLIRVRYRGYSGKEYNEELVFLNKKDAVKCYEKFCEYTDKFIKSVEFNQVESK